ncbi:hypothetical protein ASPWEDRAFT_171135 [Aspergillus wentii DTO 134E9]|uniref:Lariat debranching enzyme C-terminal domain-containing protein n=1 Tax=Aspergillus wentii DTO 134E9 TaxID=1073089 RepID=A0A1L9RRS4_ASPWE|nr:uncharacterized protein ASPWEDRAFT_171135 [Aspergillus wentii DTO 134E9]KAI9930507.1 lariat debranching enzyme [Aspergillus wentii]OJJ37666.1 hypothetical protein ASPWEDRAFT_171135 [Aspergillus wentii DTO 134E9]
MESSNPNSPSLRVAVEGCGHGCLHDIYASVERAAALKGWDGVDLLIIGGDFQAVRNSHDMACMSVPQKFKAIGDFHEYYSGKRTAPYLTIFIGGNHEASNYLFELYYGGWVAPNIYYLGAANIIRCGPLRIAGMSGIWKGYDFRKSHFERIPYNNDDLQSIYHVRELDVRKLLQIRTQVDLGLSHDWPKQVEYGGDYDTLFRIKRGFGEDSSHGRLGSPAAKYVLDRLRPAYWFSAHLHVKFAASVQHGEYVIPGKQNAIKPNAPPDSSSQAAPKAPYSFGMDGAVVTTLFSDEELENDQSLPVRSANTDSNIRAPEPTPQVDNKSSGSITHEQPQNDVVAQNNTSSSDTPQPNPNPAEPGDTQGLLSAWNDFHNVASKNEAAENSRFLMEQDKRLQEGSTPDVKHNLTWRKIDIDEDAGRRLTGIERTGDESPESKKQKMQNEPVAVKNSDEIDLDLDSDSDQETTVKAAPETEHNNHRALDGAAAGDTNGDKTDGLPKDSKQDNSIGEADVSEDLRSQLPASFARPQPDLQPRIEAVHEPLPEAIFNKNTQFLALDKCLPNRNFLQLLEIPSISEQTGDQLERPYRLQYDKEWLAITRVFAQDLELGDPNAKPPADKGDAVYKSEIVEAEKWIEEHVVKPGKMNVPENFTPTAPFYDPDVPVTTTQMPPEYSNPQTAQFCELVGIENKFHLSDEQRQARANAGPRPSHFRGGGGSGRFSRRGGGGHGSGRRGGGRGRGPRY